MYSNIKLIIVAFFIFVSSGCASIISGTAQTVSIDSQPQGAEVSIDGAYVGITPLTMKIAKNKKDMVSVKKEGYRTVSRELTKKLDPVAIINIFWDLSTTDFITGAAMEYDPGTYFFELAENNSAE